MGDYAKAESLFNKAIDIHNKVENYADKAVDLHNLGSVYADQNQFTQAVRYLEQALKLKEENHQERSLTITLAELGRVLSKSGSYQRAEELLFRGQEMAIEQSNLTLQLRIAENLAEHYEKTGNIREAFSYQKRANSLKDSTFNRDYIQKLNQLYVAFETEQTKGELLEEKVKTGELEKAKADSDLKIAQRNNWLIAALGGILVLVLGGGFFFYSNKQQEKARIAEVKIEEQQKGLKAIIYAQEEERKRIAKDLHDGIVQQLGGLKLGLQKVFSQEENPEARKMMALLDDSTQELRELSHQMMPHALSELGLIPAIEDMLDKSLGHSEMIYQFETFGISDQQRFEESVEISLYRIVQELINNVIKHSGASRVHIQLMKTGPNLTLIVEDNGQGFQPKSMKTGIGLMNISSRLETIDGKVNFEPSPEGGTLAIVKIPIK
ncbi:MAG: sensor histidine kinase [Bacteroidia bacterium]